MVCAKVTCILNVGPRAWIFLRTRPVAKVLDGLY
jgi:hypothetical protein